MPIRLEFLNLIVPITNIRKRYPGGWEQCLIDHQFGIESGRNWYDEDLFRDGAMNPMDMGFLLDRWREMGFKTHVRGKNARWKEVCIVDYAPTLPCDWIEISPDSTARYIGKGR
jgi:hypothetical protein